eukprot:s357_g25.t1
MAPAGISDILHTRCQCVRHDGSDRRKSEPSGTQRVFHNHGLAGSRLHQPWGAAPRSGTRGSQRVQANELSYESERLVVAATPGLAHEHALLLRSPLEKFRVGSICSGEGSTVVEGFGQFSRVCTETNVTSQHSASPNRGGNVRPRPLLNQVKPPARPPAPNPSNEAALDSGIELKHIEEMERFLRSQGKDMGDEPRATIRGKVSRQSVAADDDLDDEDPEDEEANPVEAEEKDPLSTAVTKLVDIKADLTEACYPQKFNRLRSQHARHWRDTGHKHTSEGWINLCGCFSLQI